MKSVKFIKLFFVFFSFNSVIFTLWIWQLSEYGILDINVPWWKYISFILGFLFLSLINWPIEK